MTLDTDRRQATATGTRTYYINNQEIYDWAEGFELGSIAELTVELPDIGAFAGNANCEPGDYLKILFEVIDEIGAGVTFAVTATLDDNRRLQNVRTRWVWVAA